MIAVEVLYCGEPALEVGVTVSTNTGHVAEQGFDMAKFAFGHPERLADFGWRSVHEMTEKGKAITAAHYGRTTGVTGIPQGQ